MKTSFKLLILTLFALGAGCIDNQELEPPTLTVSNDPEAYITFSWREPATVHINIQSEEDIERFTMTSKPLYWQMDSVFPPYTHFVDFDYDFTLKRGFEVKDSTAVVEFRAYSNGLFSEQLRKFKYEFNYPAIDSFDIELSANPLSGNCLLDIESQEAYAFTQYRNHHFDLVLVNERRVMWRNFGLSLASPDAEDYIRNYFIDYIPEWEYKAELSNVTFRKTRTGIVTDSYLTFDDLTPKILDDDDNLQYTCLGGDEAFGYGLSSLEVHQLYKIKMYNNKKAMINVMEIKGYGSQYPTVCLRVYYQKD